MNFRLTAALFAGVLVLVVALLVTALTDGDAGADAGGLAGPLTVAGLTEKDVTSVEIARTKPTDETLVLTREGEGKWRLTAPVTAKVDGFAVDALVRDVFRAKPVIVKGLPDNVAVAELDPATVRVTLKAGDKSATVNVGRSTIGDDKSLTLVSTGERPNKVVAVPQRELAGLFKDSARGKDGSAWELVRDRGDFRSRRPLGADLVEPLRDLKAVKLSAGGKDVALAREGSDWKFTAPPNYGVADANGASEPVPGAFTGVRPLLTALTAIQAGGPTDFLESPGDLSQYGLKPGDPAAVRVELVPASGTPEVLFLGKAVEENGKPVTPAKVYARVEGDPAVMKVQADQAEVIRKTVADPSELRNRDVLAESLRDRADALDITVNGQTAKLRKVTVGAAPKWLLYGGPGDPKEANQQAVSDLLALLTRPRLATDVLAGPYDAAFGPGQRKAEIKLWAGAVEAEKAADGKLPPEPKLKGNPTELVLGQKDGTNVFLRRTADGKSADFKVADTTAAAATKTRLDFLDVKLKTFDPGSITTFAIARNGETTEVTKAAGPGGAWTFTQPARLKGKPADAAAVAGFLTVLLGVSPATVVAEQPTPDDLKKWGLDPAAPRLKVTANDIEFRFGGETDDKLYAYATQSGGPWVFTVPKVVPGRFEPNDLRDKTLYQIDPAKVTGLRIRGWKALTGSPQTYEFEKKGADWVAKAPPTPAGFQPDGVKLAALLNQLAAPNVVRYAGVGQLAHGLDPAANPDAVEFTVIFPAPTPAVTLVLGGPADGGVYAASSVIPGESVVLNPDPIRKLVEKPTALGK